MIGVVLIASFQVGESSQHIAIRRLDTHHLSHLQVKKHTRSMGKQGRAFGLAKKGKIGIALEKPSYIAGEVVRGTIYVEIYEPIQCDGAYNVLAGSERSSWVIRFSNSALNTERSMHDNSTRA